MPVSKRSVIGGSGAILAALSAFDLHAESLDFAMGKALFDRPWTSAPAVTQATDGLGPLFNARSCVACHPKAGRGKITIQEDGQIGGLGYVIRLGNEKGEADPIYGRQFQANAIHGHRAEGIVFFKDGYYEIADLAYGEMSAETKFAGRLSQPLHGLGLLELVSDETILNLADPDDKNGDGISGRPNMIDGKIGRFAWKATAPTLHIQAATAFFNDIGMSTPINPQHYGDCTENQKPCREAIHGNSPQFEDLEIDTQMLDLIVAYLRGLKPPQSLPVEGIELFEKVGCADCHIPELPLTNGQTVAAFTDLLLHDMGDELADDIKEGEATGQEWRTQPLWGTAKTERFLHDGRATSVLEAIGFHGGEAEKAKQAFHALDTDDKTKLLTFINSL